MNNFFAYLLGYAEGYATAWPDLWVIATPLARPQASLKIFKGRMKSAQRSDKRIVGPHAADNKSINFIVRREWFYRCLCLCIIMYISCVIWFDYGLPSVVCPGKLVNWYDFCWFLSSELSERVISRLDIFKFGAGETFIVNESNWKSFSLLLQAKSASSRCH